MEERKYPVGIQTFSEVIRGGYIYIDKTELVWHLEVPSSAFDQPTENMSDALPLLYQGGYLTIKAYDRELETYTLSIPNQEVRIGYTEGLLPVYNERGYALSYETDGRKIVKVGIRFNPETMSIEEWMVNDR